MCRRRRASGCSADRARIQRNVLIAPDTHGDGERAAGYANSLNIHLIIFDTFGPYGG
jgi:hypothetical protein